MGTQIRAEVSKKNKYWIEKHRYYELKHFCLQYPIWKAAYHSLDGLSGRPGDLQMFSRTNTCNDPTTKCAEAMLFYSQRMAMIENAAKLTDEVIGKYVLKGVTEGKSYELLQISCGVPCNKNTYYELYRRFFWILNKERN